MLQALGACDSPLPLRARCGLHCDGAASHRAAVPVRVGAPGAGGSRGLCGALWSHDPLWFAGVAGDSDGAFTS